MINFNDFMEKWKACADGSVSVLTFGNISIGIGFSGYAIERIKRIIITGAEFGKDEKGNFSGVVEQLALIEGIEFITDSRHVDDYGAKETNPLMNSIFIYRDFKDKVNGSWEVLLPKIKEVLKKYYQ